MPSKPESEQDRQLRRVTGSIAEHIQAFFDLRRDGEEFHAVDLHGYVQSAAQIAPASADRVMREMRRLGQINYSVVNRRQSLYRKECLK